METTIKRIDDLEAKKQNPFPSLEERYENLKVKFNGLTENLKDSKSKEEKARLKLEQTEIEDEMEKCRLEIFRNK